VRVVTVTAMIRITGVSGATPSHTCECNHMHASAHIHNTTATHEHRGTQKAEYAVVVTL